MTSSERVRVTKGSVVYPKVAEAIAKVGQDISLARRMRRITAEEFAQRMGVSRATLHRLENGDPGVSLNTLSMALAALGRLDAITKLADPAGDDIGVMLTRHQAPRRIQRARPKRIESSEPDVDDAPGADSSGYVGW